MNKVALTETGKRKAEVSSDMQGLRYAIINYIESHGDSTLSEVADAVNANQSEVRTKINQLIREDWLIWTGDMGSDDWDMN
jgi:MarR-like DNA-binding transcriptional regulator SgrR of sgrS sRNA